MKASEIKQGQWYTNDKGRFRLVTGAPRVPRMLNKGTQDGIEFVTVSTTKRGQRALTAPFCSERMLGTRKQWVSTCTLITFARWAKRQATDDEAAAAIATLERFSVVGVL